jgi:integral membrane sensor domain MASE1
MSETLREMPRLPLTAAAADDNNARRRSMGTEIKRKLAFALLMGIVTTGIISSSLLALNLGFSNEFPRIWLRSWAIGYAIVIPAILLIGPRLQARVDRLFDKD